MATFTLDPYEGKTLDEMKDRARELVRAVSRWQMTAVVLASRHGTDGLGAERAEEVNRLIEAYKD
jgi:predicted nucleotidyltransferase